ncbi:MAG: hypothetical protein IBX48_07885 [Thiomicrospira sp.]|uniref:hypothetical protein n=1 Tax=Thiomicrospira sp. TaxID=935 RepID=UPI0019DA6518|nr:hypothetical protein [Thiomicrospira sp.]MBE0494249.1 hypothetical protein [Thiomicrospira sp.]
MKKLLVGATVLATLTLGACAHNQQTDKYAALVNEAKAKQDISKETGNIWHQRAMKKPYVEHYLEEAEKARLESVRLANEAVRSANAQIAQTEEARAMTPGWYKNK